MNLDIKLAWERLKYDIAKRHFIEYRFQLQLILTDIVSWLDKIKNEFDSGNYNPSPSYISEIPKGRGLIRPGTHLTFEDSLFYIALISECYGKIFEKLKWSQGLVDYAYVLSDNFKRNDWFINQFEGWSNFRIESLKKIEEGYSYVVFTDITGFYDNIDLSLLSSDLRNCNIEMELVNQFGKCLNKWAAINNRGIPQGQSASDILAKLYLNPIDLGLKNYGFIELRYVDDIRIFCKSKSEAKKALIELSRLMRKRGLNLQSAKTKILNAVDAYSEIESIFPIIRAVVNRLKEESFVTIDSLYGGSSEYYNPDAEISEDSEKVLEETFQSYFIDAEESKFDKSLLHYLLNRLKDAQNSYALDYCLAILETHPEETTAILDYSLSIGKLDEELNDSKNRMINKLVEFLQSDQAIYHYQNYQIINWLVENCKEPKDSLKTFIRSLAYDSRLPYYLQRSARIFLSKHGDDSDIDRLENQYSLASNEIEKADIVCCLERLEKGRRNALLGRIRSDGYLIKLACEKVKNV